jgi:hypothetical protein
MTTDFDSFGQSGLRDFIESPLHVRDDAAHGCTGEDQEDTGACCVEMSFRYQCLHNLTEQQCTDIDGLFAGIGIACPAREECPLETPDPVPDFYWCVCCCKGPGGPGSLCNAGCSNYRPNDPQPPGCRYIDNCAWWIIRMTAIPESGNRNCIGACCTDIGDGSVGEWCSPCCYRSGGAMQCLHKTPTICALYGGWHARVGQTCTDIANCSDDPADLGACCIPSTSTCIDSLNAGECFERYGGEWMGPGSLCVTANICPGACCVSESVCHDNMRKAACDAIDGSVWQGQYTKCEDV